ncbi:MAG: Gfo/Idh/MocA family oxidoreductase [Kordiimonadaceae bacterium]|nr:Gfo/Idh/MocA family oxidoreductase [Kordiimonadaceae bacterium]
MSNGNFRIAVIGLGDVASVHLDAYEQLDGLDIASVCDVRENVAQTVAARFDAKAYADYKALLSDDTYDLVLVLTPASTHCEIVSAVAAAGFHVFCEKPLAVTQEEGKAIVTACDDAGVKLFYGSCYRYLPAVKKARDLIQAGAIGRVQLMTEQLIGGLGLAAYEQLGAIHYASGGSGGAGMGLVDHGIHLIDIFSWLAGSPIIRAEGRGQISGAPATSEVMSMYFDNGAMGVLTYNAATYSTALPNEGMFSGGQGYNTDNSISGAGSWEGDPGSICIYGTEGALRIFHYTNALYLNDQNGLRRIEISGRPSFGHFATQLEDCIAAIKDNREPSVTGMDGIVTIDALLQLYEK